MNVIGVQLVLCTSHFLHELEAGSVAGVATRTSRVVKSHGSLPFLLDAQVYSYEEQSDEEEKRTDGEERGISEEQRPLVGRFLAEALLEGVVDGSDEEVEVPPDDGDEEQVDGNDCGLDLTGRQVNHNGRGHAHPHLSDDVGGKEREEAPRIRQEQGTRCKWCSQQLYTRDRNNNKRR